MVLDNDILGAEPVTVVSGDDRKWVPAAGVAAAVLVGSLVFGVVHTARNATHPAPPASIPSPATSSAPRHPVLSTPPPTSYAVPTAQTSAGAPEPSTSSAGPVPPVPADSAPESAVPAPTTIFNPYATTTAPNAGAI